MKKFNTLIGLLVACSLTAMVAGETKLDSHLDMAIHYANIGAIFEGKTMYDSARVYYEESMKNSTDRRPWLDACFAMIQIYIEKDELNTASIYLAQAEKTTQEIQSKEHFAIFYNLKYRFYDKKGDLRKALDNYILSRNYEDSIYNIENVNHINNLQVRYETDLRENQIALQTIELKQKKLERNLFLYGFLLAVILLLLLWYMLLLRIRRSSILMEANATKDKFFTIISHDLKNPAIQQLNALKILIDNQKIWSKESLANYCNELLKSAESNMELIYNLLNWAQVQTGSMPFRPTTFDLVAELRPDISLITNMAARKGLTVHVEMPDKALVVSDSTMILTVIRNLLTNAVKFTPAGGTVTLSVYPPENGKYNVSVSDTGTGMTEEQLHDLFCLDRQHSLRGTTGEQGTGLGLIVCRELLEKHGTTLHVKSKLGEGSKFWFECDQGKCIKKV